MTEVMALEGYVPEGLQPIGPELLSLVPVKVGERVALHDLGDPDHPEHEHSGMYGVINAIGYADGEIKLDLLVIDPATGEHTGKAPTMRRTGLGEIQ